ncbi:MAG: trypsin-like peptidase domain-containing protein [Planctomycetes bacterium]|nr:trypsin-like peptidase domain-containing protein [Planctomycetota bacterium]MBL7007911.1 trypsin-like peptidase domain-containing protein [Planctomycetota bacterium]
MTTTRPILLLLVGLVAGLALSLAPEARSGRPAEPAQLLELSDALEELSAQVLRSTVHIFVESQVDGRKSGSSGTGFVVDAIQGLVVTNNHVVNPPHEGDQDPSKVFVKVTLADGRVFPAEIVARDELTDIAVVRIPEGAARRQLSWGDSDQLRPGTMVMAVGNPLGLVGTTSTGVISGLNRSVGILRGDGYEDFLQHDAVIDQGSSGGPLVNMRGELVGVNTAISPDQQRKAQMGMHSWNGVSFSVPSRLARKVAEDLVEFGEVRRGYLGVDTEDLDASRAKRSGLPRPFGAYIKEVMPDTPAAGAGLKVGDILLEVDGREVLGPSSLRSRISAYSPGDLARIKIWRNKAAIELQVELAIKPKKG